MGYRNDVSFVIGGDTMLWEHQSTTNPNMPLRGLMYFALLYRRYLDSTDQSELSSRLVLLPTPRYYVFYNGTDDRPDREALLLSGSFVNGSGDVEVAVTVLNVNEGQNDGIMESCEALRGYEHLTALYRAFAATMEPRDAMDAAIDACIADSYLVDYLKLRRSEVLDMLLAQWKEEEYRKLLRQEAAEDGYDEGFARGEEEGLTAGFARGEESARACARAETLEHVAKAVRDGELGLSAAASIFGFTEEEVSASL